MSFKNILETIICDEVNKVLPRFTTDLAMNITFNTRIDWDKEDGYRYADLVIYRPTNYTSVYTRRRWNVIPVEDLGDDDSGPLPGKSYVQGETGWTLICCHDSGWRDDGIGYFLQKNEKDIISLYNLKQRWYHMLEKIDHPPDQTWWV